MILFTGLGFVFSPALNRGEEAPLSLITAVLLAIAL